MSTALSLREADVDLSVSPWAPPAPAPADADERTVSVRFRVPASQPPHLNLPTSITPIDLPRPKRTSRNEVEYLGVVEYVRTAAPTRAGFAADIVEADGAYVGCCGCRAVKPWQRQQQRHQRVEYIDVKVIRPDPSLGPACSMPSDRAAPSVPASRVSASEQQLWFRSPALKGRLRSPFAHGFSSVSRERPGRYFSPRRTKSEPTPATSTNAVSELEAPASSAPRVSFSVHA